MDVKREIPIVKCSGGKLPNQRAPFVRSTFDWAVCSEPLARLRRTRDYGDSIFADRFGFVTRGGLGLKRVMQVVRKQEILRLMDVCDLQSSASPACRHTSSGHARNAC